MKKTVESAIRQALTSLSWTLPHELSVEIESPKVEAHGDLATPVAMSLAKTLRKKPMDIAREIISCIPKQRTFERIEIAGAGFINFTFSREFLYFSLKSLLREKKKFLRQDIGKGIKVQIEFVSANPTGPLHLGHGRGAAVGAALSNLLNAAGYSVHREYYINDKGKQCKLLGQSVFARYKELLGIAYPFPEDGYWGDYVITAAEAIREAVGERYKDASFKEVEKFFTDFSLRMMLSGIKDDLESFGIKFDSYQSEKELYEIGDVFRSIDYLKDKGNLYEKDGALWFRATRFGDDKDRVIIKQDGEHTYFASDIAYHMKKINAGFNELINIWGADHHGYIPRIEAVMDALGYERKKLVVLLVQLVTLMRGGKIVPMSKRLGEFVTLKEVIKEVGADTTKFIFLTRRHDSHLEFDLEVAKSVSSENPVYYVQYANARIGSVLSYASEKGITLEGQADLELLTSEEELKIIKKLLMYPMIFEASVLSREPHRITFYLQELSTMFHRYYNKYRIVGDDGALSYARLSLVEAVRTVLKEGLEILGVTAPERM
ncbi:MAG: arginine--tRNA ligase [Nitrospirae bacterium]|nr:arginine--tRNA ligase [Nitrospirota bacterium]